MKPLVVFLATVTGALVVGVLRSLLQPRPEEFAEFGVTLGDVVVVPTRACESSDWWSLTDDRPTGRYLETE